jgi:hypothetical protein
MGVLGNPTEDPLGLNGDIETINIQNFTQQNIQILIANIVDILESQIKTVDEWRNIYESKITETANEWKISGDDKVDMKKY